MRRLARGLSLILFSLLLTLLLGLGMFLALGFLGASQPRPMGSVQELSDNLRAEADGYALPAEMADSLRAAGCWAMLLDGEGRVVWSLDKPPEVADRFSAGQIAVFSRWFLEDYPVSVWEHGEGLAVLGWPRHSMVKYNLYFDFRYFRLLLLLLPVLFVAICCAILLYSRHAFAKEQARRDAARAHWIDGISHDIRTPLSLVMGYAGQWTLDPTLSVEQRREAGRMVEACTNVKTLISDLNLTMRLDYEMQPLRLQRVTAASLLREAAAETLNNGLAEDIEWDVQPAQEDWRLNADPVLVHRALMNLLQNALRHGGSGPVRLRLRQSGRLCVMEIENECEGAAACAARLNREDRSPAVTRDGAAAHGTGLHLVRRVAAAHHGRLRFCAEGERVLCAQLCLPLLRPRRL